MKKILLIICILLLTTGCTNITKSDYKDIIENKITTNTKNKRYNIHRTGYKYYLPKNMSVKDGFDYNEKITSNNYTYYLYVDIISYFNKSRLHYEENRSNYISYKFNNKDKMGYIEVNQIENKYLVEIIYNYAKIEVRVDKINLNEIINNSMIILSTIKYDDDIIDNLIGENKITNKEETLNIFKDKKEKDDYLDLIDENEDNEENNKIPDYDVIN